MNFLKLLCAFILLSCGNAIAQNKYNSTSEDINFTSDNIEANEKTGVMTASGNVVITAKNRKIIANKVVYNQKTDEAIASGNVVIYEKDGSSYESQKIVLTNEFKSIIAIPLYGELADKSWITASKLERNDLGQSFFIEGVYSACKCNVKEGENPIWRIESKSIHHDPLKKTIYIKHANMKIFSAPIFYIPYLSIPDWTVKRKTGFLTPSFGYSKRNRVNVKIPFYYAPENDLTWDMTFTSHQNGTNGHADQINFRKKYENSSLSTNIFSGNLNTNKSDGDDVFGMNLSASSKLENKWELTLEGKYADQDTFMRRYGFDQDTSYKSFVNVEKTKNNSFSKIEFYNIENLDETNNKNNEPVLAPSISHHIFNSNSKYNYDIKLNAHSIYNDEGYDIKRWSGLGELSKTIILDDLTLESIVNLGLDLYSIQGRPFNDANKTRYINRFSSGFSLAASQQQFLNSNNANIILEPKIQISSMFSPDKYDDIPNRDSSEYRIDEANLFLNNQYQGRDNIQKNSKINAGLYTLIMTEDFGDYNFFIGQSKRISGSEENIISADNDRKSSIINSIDWNMNDNFRVAWFSLYNQHSLTNELSNFYLEGKLNDWTYSTNYRSINRKVISDGHSREQLSYVISKEFENLKTSYSTTYDLNNGKNENVSENFKIEYTEKGYMFGNCLTIGLQYKSEGAINDRDIISEDSLFLTFSFRNLGDAK